MSLTYRILSVIHDPTIYTGIWMSPSYRILSVTKDPTIYTGTWISPPYRLLSAIYNSDNDVTLDVALLGIASLYTEAAPPIKSSSHLTCCLCECVCVWCIGCICWCTVHGLACYCCYTVLTFFSSFFPFCTAWRALVLTRGSRLIGISLLLLLLGCYHCFLSPCQTPV